jgi:hypothetical protein
LSNNGQQTVCNDFNECFTNTKKKITARFTTPRHRLWGPPFSAAAEQSLQLRIGDPETGFFVFMLVASPKNVSKHGPKNAFIN